MRRLWVATTAGGTAQALAKFDGKSNSASSEVFDTGTNVGIGRAAKLMKESKARPAKP